MFSKLFLGLLLVCSLPKVQDLDTLDTQKDTQSLYNISLTDISGAPLDLSQYKGKKILFVNVASKCGFTSQYDDLQELYTTYKDRLVVIGLPCNQFGGQEPGTTKEIVTFCKVNYGVAFPLSSKLRFRSHQNCVSARGNITSSVLTHSLTLEQPHHLQPHVFEWMALGQRKRGGN